MKKYYFAYGSNMSQKRLESRIGKVKKIGVALLRGYVLVFNAGFNDQCFANLYKTGNYEDTVDGVIYELTRDQLRTLDQFEGTPMLYNRVIERYGKFTLNVYISFNASYCQQGGIRPDTNYLTHCIIGCKENNLSRTLAILEKI